nr:MAG TPA: hypothetical protein [Caudoviricetes sp.]
MMHLVCLILVNFPQIYTNNRYLQPFELIKIKNRHKKIGAKPTSPTLSHSSNHICKPSYADHAPRVAPV